MKAQMLRIVFFFLVVLSFACKKKNEDAVTPDTVVSAEVRIKALEDCKAKFREFNGIVTGQDKQKLVDWLKTRPEFEAAGIAEAADNVWARFTDGRFLMFVNNRKTVPIDLRGGRKGQDEPITQPKAGEKNGELPTPVNAILMNGMGSYYIDQTACIGNIFAAVKTGYKVSKQKASVENLKKNVKDAGVFFLTTHGGETRLRLSPSDTSLTLGFWSTDQVTLATDASLDSDLKQGNLGYMVAYNDEPTSGNMTVEAHYAFTASFVDTYMNFGENAYIHFSACNSFRQSASGAAFRKAILKKPGVFAGWTLSVYETDAYVAAQFMFDRLLGANGVGSSTDLPIPKEDPNQRPFPVESVFQDLKIKGLATSGLSNLRIENRSTFNGTGFLRPFILNPSIDSLEIDEVNSELSIYGIFGSDPRSNGGGEVTVDATSAQIKIWTTTKITCTIPFEGSGSAGNVIVKVRGNESNLVPLTEWKIELNVKEGTTQRIDADIILHLRADVHRSRKKPGEKDPKRPGENDMETDVIKIQRAFAQDSKLVLTASGSCSYSCGCQTNQSRVSGSREYKLLQLSGTGQGLLAKFGWEKRNKINLLLTFNEQQAFSYANTTGGCGDPSKTNTNSLPFVFATINASGSTITYPSLEFANPDQFDFSIKAGSFTFLGANVVPQCSCNSTPVLPVITWKVCKPQFAPDAKTAARMGNFQ
ncbi:MAG: hypothetical protein H7Y04_14060 [Verrucomicrobia bacterium]|nr:hypothetical protein [Cytophagales bacterium]